MYICPECSTETTASPCPNCGAEISGVLDEVVYDITLTGFEDENGRDKVVEYLLSLSKSQDVGKIKKSIERLPVIIYRNIPQYKAESIIRRFKNLGAHIEYETRSRTIKVDKFFDEEFKEQSEAKPPAGRRGIFAAAAIIALLLIGFVVYLVYPRPVEEVVQAPKPAPSKSSILQRAPKSSKSITTRTNREKASRRKPAKVPASTPSTSERTKAAQRNSEEEADEKVLVEINWNEMVSAAQAPSVNVSPIEPNEELEEDPAYDHVQRGTALFNEKKFDEALDAFEAALGTDPEREEIIENAINTAIAWGWQTIADEDYGQAIEAFGIAMDYDDKDPLLYKGAGIANFLSGHYDDALHDLLFAIEEHPDDKHALLAIARIYNIKGANDQSTKYFEDYLRQVPKDEEVRRYMGQLREGP